MSIDKTFYCVRCLAEAGKLAKINCRDAPSARHPGETERLWQCSLNHSILHAVYSYLSEPLPSIVVEEKDLAKLALKLQKNIARVLNTQVVKKQMKATP